MNDDPIQQGVRELEDAVKVDANPALAVQIPQVLSAAMAAGVFICIAQRTGGFFLAPGCAPWQDYVLGFAMLVTIGAWNAKNFVDDFKAFARQADGGFSLGPTVAFGAASFTALGTASTLLFDGFKSVWALAAFFFICAAWSATSWIRRRRKNSSDAEIPKRFKRVIYYSLCGMLLLIPVLSASWIALAVVLSLVVVIFVLDAREYKTFSSSM